MARVRPALTCYAFLFSTNVEVTAITSRGEAGALVSEMFPSFRRRLELKFEDAAVVYLAKCDVVFFASDGLAMRRAPRLLDAGVRVIDLAGFRIKDIPEWEKWNAMKHASPEWVGKAAHGLPECARKLQGHD